MIYRIRRKVSVHPLHVVINASSDPLAHHQYDSVEGFRLPVREAMARCVLIQRQYRFTHQPARSCSRRIISRTAPSGSARIIIPNRFPERWTSGSRTTDTSEINAALPCGLRVLPAGFDSTTPFLSLRGNRSVSPTTVFPSPALWCTFHPFTTDASRDIYHKEIPDTG